MKVWPVKNMAAKGYLSTAIFTVSRLTCTALGMAGGLLTVRLVAPATLGFFNTVLIGQGYLTWLQLGIFNGLNRELPYLYGKGDIEKAHGAAAAAQFWSLLLGVITFTGFICAGVVSIVFGKRWLGVALIVNAVLAFSSFYSGYLGITFRTKHDFVRLAVIELVVALVSVGLLSVIWMWGFYGICLRSGIIALTTLVILFMYRPVRVRPKWSRTEFKHLIGVGLPIYLTAQVHAWWTVSLSPSWIAWRDGPETMGLYALVVVVYSAASMLAMSVSQVYYPRLVEEYAVSCSLSRLFRILHRPVAALLLVYFLTLGAGWYLVPDAVRLLAPCYAGAAFSAQYALLSCVVYGFYPMLLIFSVIKRQRLYLGCMLVGIGVHVGMLFGLTRGSHELHLVVISELVGKACFVLACGAVLYRIWKGRPSPCFQQQ